VAVRRAALAMQVARAPAVLGALLFVTMIVAEDTSSMGMVADAGDATDVAATCRLTVGTLIPSHASRMPLGWAGKIWSAAAAHLLVCSNWNAQTRVMVSFVKFPDVSGSREPSWRMFLTLFLGFLSQKSQFADPAIAGCGRLQRFNKVSRQHA
jgi:hypothetical protein